MVQILFVDDEPAILKALERIFRRQKDWTCYFVDSPLEALKVLAKKDITVIVSDHRMPQMEGAEFLARVKEKRPKTIRMMLTGQADLQAVQTAINAGEIYRFMLKPWDDKELLQAVKNAVEFHTITDENERLTQQVQQQNEELTAINEELEERIQERTRQVSDALYTAKAMNEQLEKTLEESTKTLVTLVQLACPEIGSHSKRVKQHVIALGKRFKMDETEVRELELAALLHDNGKLGTPAFLIERNIADYDESELTIYKKHPVIGAQNLSNIQGYENVCDLIRSHHELYDGSGFPKGIKGANTSIGAYILGISDKLDYLLQSPHPNPEYVYQHAFQTIADSSDKEYPSKLVQEVLDYMEETRQNGAQDDSLILSIAELSPNMRLARDIYSMSGSLILAADSILTSHNIELLRSIAKVDPIAGKISITRKPRLTAKC